MIISQRNVDFALSIARARDNQPYWYGGCWDPANVERSSDCSGVVTHMLDALVNGPQMTWSRHGLCTESYRYVGGPGSVGPFGTIRVADPSGIPDDAVLRVGLFHGPGGGVNSHMACTLEGIAIESSGTNGQQIGPPARGYDDPMFHDWFYLPGPIPGAGAHAGTPYPPDSVQLRVGSDGPLVMVLQARLNRDYPLYSNLNVDGHFGERTRRVVEEFERHSGLVVDGIAGSAVLTLLGLPTSTTDKAWAALAKELDKTEKGAKKLQKSVKRGIPQRNVDFALSIARARDNQPYWYGGCWDPANVERSSDCSGVVTHMLDALVNGPQMTWSRHGLCTESYRYVGGPGSVGPFGTIRVADPSGIPDDAVLRVGLFHGPGGGVNSHMACTLEGIAIESSGTNGQQIGPPARGYDDPMFRDWFYLPGPIIRSGPGCGAAAYPPDSVQLRVGSDGPLVMVLQGRLNRDYPLYSNLNVDGHFGEVTKRVVEEFQRRSGLVVDGIAGSAVLTLLGLPASTSDDEWKRLFKELAESGGQPGSRKDDYTRAIIAEGRRRKITPQGIKIALATALVESNLVMYANKRDPESLKFPHERLSEDYDSVGLFQQRPPWWGTVADRMDPRKSAAMFYAALAKLDYESKDHDPGWYAQKVQNSAVPDAYQKRFDEACRLYERLADTASVTSVESAVTKQRAATVKSRSAKAAKRPTAGTKTKTAGTGKKPAPVRTKAVGAKSKKKGSG